MRGTLTGFLTHSSDTGPARHSASLSPDWVIVSDFGRLLDLQGHVRGGVQTFRLMEPRAGLSAHLGIFFFRTLMPLGPFFPVHSGGQCTYLLTT